MQQLNAREVKEKIRDYLEMVGPILPVQVSRHLKMETLFASAFLSEMIADKTIKISHMRVGGSPLYYTPSKESMLENFYQHLGGKEKEAFMILKEKGIIKDEEQQPAIRIALRALKDFAIPFQENGKLYWKYFLNKEVELEKESVTEEKKDDSEEKTSKVSNESEVESLKKELENKRRELEKIREEMKVIPQKVQKPKKGIIKKLAVDDIFLEEVKKRLIGLNLEIIDYKEYEKNAIILNSKKGSEEIVIIAFDRKSIKEKDILKAYKNAGQKKFLILLRAEPPRKIRDNAEAYKHLENITPI
jgi:hypothetical protein